MIEKLIILDSSMVEHSAVNRVVVGSSPTRGVYINYILLKYVVYVMMIQSLNTGVVNSVGLAPWSSG